MYRWDGGFIMVHPDQFEDAIQWYQDVFGWECMDQITSWVGRKGFMKLPRAGMVTIKSFEGDHDHLQSPETEGNVRLGFATYHLDQTLSYLEDRKIEASAIKQLPNGQRYCDIVAFDNTRLTLVEENKGEDEREYHPSGVLGFGNVNVIIHVKDPVFSASWYKEHLGFAIEEIDEGRGFAHLKTEDAYDRNVLNECFWDHIWLLKSKDTVSKPNDNRARTYYDIRPEFVFDEYHRLIKIGLEPSEMAGDPINGWGGFHFYDPDNNRINVWSYK